MCGFVGVVRAPGRGVRRDELTSLRGSARRGAGPTGRAPSSTARSGCCRRGSRSRAGTRATSRRAAATGASCWPTTASSSPRTAVCSAGRSARRAPARCAATSDTELLLAWLAHRLAERGVGAPVPFEAFEPLRGGMYAFALVDLATREVLLHTDGGIKPLYVATRPDAGETWFSSIRTPLVDALRPRLELDPFELARRLLCPWSPGALARSPVPVEEVGGRTALVHEGVRRWLAPPGRPRAGRTLDAARAAEPGRTAPALDEVREAYADAAREAAETTGPVSIFLSGGLDSAGVAAWCGRPDALTLTGRFGPAGGPFDESAAAHAVARGLGLRHETVDLSDRDLLLDLDDVLDALEEPMGGPGSLAIHRMAHRARAHGRVGLSGTGGDERFGGYTRIALALDRAGEWTVGYEALAARMAAAGPDPRRRWLAAMDRSSDLLPWLDPAFASGVPLEEAGRRRLRRPLRRRGGSRRRRRWPASSSRRRSAPRCACSSRSRTA